MCTEVHIFTKFTYFIVHTFSKFHVCLFGVFPPTQEFFTHMETSPLQMRGCKI